MAKTLVALLGLAAGVANGADKVSPVPGWSIQGRAPHAERMKLVVAVKQQNKERLEELFWAVSNPASPQWRHFMSIEEIGSLVQSKEEDMQAVTQWLRSGLSSDALVQPTYDAVNIDLTIAEAEALFATEVFTLVNAAGKRLFRSTEKLSVPPEVAAAIDFVEGLNDLPMERAPIRKVPKGKQPNAITPIVVPQTLQEMYGIPSALENLTSTCAAEYQDQNSYDPSQLVTFFQQMNLPNEPMDDTIGPFLPSPPGVEATLDVQYLLAIAQNQTNYYWTTPSWMYSWAQAFFSTPQVPDIVSMSYAWADDAQCQVGNCGAETSEQYVNRVNAEFQKIGLRGVSLLGASGDSGANGRTDEYCMDSVLHADFPASSPYITSVGATQLEQAKFDLQTPPPACAAQSFGQCASGGVEVAVSSQQAGFTSGGGFSTYAAMPSYQTSVVQHYLTSESSKLPPASFFKRQNRGYPDVAAMGSNYLINTGSWSPVGGTSAASPVFAGIVAHLNALAYKKDGKPLGFLNPFLYQMYAQEPGAFTDVTVGDNKCTESGCTAGCQGYEAAPGWDPVTGLGTPVYPKMATYLEALLTRETQVIV